MSSDIRTFIVDSFTAEPFKGNPAGVCLCPAPLEPVHMQQIARELNLSETAFVVPTSDSGVFGIRYFSPVMEIPLCGHATLAAAKVLFAERALAEVVFSTVQQLRLTATSSGYQIEMEFPAYRLQPATAGAALLEALGVETVHYAGYNAETRILMLEIAGTDVLRDLQPDFLALERSEQSLNGVLVTAQASDGFDFHSRYFWPWSGGNEDPVTGGTHTFMAPYWGEKLGRTSLRSFQSSARTGEMEIELGGADTLRIRGHAVIVFEGVLQAVLR